jgi:hypothetical protein
MRLRATIGLPALLLCAAGALAQAPGSDAQDIPAVSSIKTGTQLVVIDVVVQDKAGNPVHGLQQSDFRLTVSNKTQAILHFEEHTAATPIESVPQLPRLPPGNFTDYTPIPPAGALNIILLDALNTPMQDQSYVRYQLQQYVQHADPSMRIAIFGLATHLVMLQNFTSDPETLKGAVEHKLIPRASVLLDNPAGTGSDSDLDLIQAAGNLAQFQTEMAAMQTSASSTRSTPSTIWPIIWHPSRAARTSSGSPAPSLSTSSPTAPSTILSPSCSSTKRSSARPRTCSPGHRSPSILSTRAA